MGKKKDPNEPYETVEPNPEFRKEVFGKNSTATKADKTKLGKCENNVTFKKLHQNPYSYLMQSKGWKDHNTSKVFIVYILVHL